MDRSENYPTAGRGATTRQGTSSELVPWSPTSEARRAPAGSPKRKRNLNFPASVALGAAGLALGVAATTLAFSEGWPVSLPNRGSLATARLEQRLTESLGALKSEVEELRGALARDRDEANASGMPKQLDELAARVETAKVETSGAIAQLTARIDPLRQETAARLQSVAERLDRLERRGDAPPGARPTDLPPDARPSVPVIRNWVVRGVYDGVALVESAQGAVEVAPGEFLPGAGRVRSIERSGRGWIVVTSRGVIDSARSRF
jgi:hypothetical protein